MRHKVHLLRAKVARLQTVLNGVDRESAGGLFAGESFLGGGGEHAVVCRQGGGGVKALGNAIFARRKIRELFFLEANAVVQSANANHIHREFFFPDSFNIEAHFSSANTLFASSTNLAPPFRATA